MSPAAKRSRKVTNVGNGLVRLVKRAYRALRLDSRSLVSTRLPLTPVIIVDRGPVGRYLGRCIGMPVYLNPRVHIEDGVIVIVLMLFHCCINSRLRVNIWQRACLGATHEIALALEHGLVLALRLVFFLLRARIAPLMGLRQVKRCWAAGFFLREARQGHMLSRR